MDAFLIHERYFTLSACGGKWKHDSVWSNMKKELARHCVSCILFLGFFFFLAYKIVKKKEIAVVHKLPSLYNISGVAWIVKICISREIELISKICYAWGQIMCI